MIAPDPLGKARLYAILDLGYVAPDDALRVAGELIRGGADLIQLRAKRLQSDEIRDLAAELHRLTSAANVPLIINDHPEIARDIPVEGLHLGQDDLSIGDAREIVRRPDCWIGKSTHSVAQAVAAQAEGADYLGFGPLFATPTKPDYAAIGIDEHPAGARVGAAPDFLYRRDQAGKSSRVLAAGAKRAVIVSGLLQNARYRRRHPRGQALTPIPKSSK